MADACLSPLGRVVDMASSYGTSILAGIFDRAVQVVGETGQTVWSLCDVSAETSCRLLSGCLSGASADA